MVSHACCVSLSVGCYYSYQKPVQPNELSAALLKGPAIFLPGSSVLVCSHRSSPHFYNREEKNTHCRRRRKAELQGNGCNAACGWAEQRAFPELISEDGMQADHALCLEELCCIGKQGSPATLSPLLIASWSQGRKLSDPNKGWCPLCKLGFFFLFSFFF